MKPTASIRSRLFLLAISMTFALVILLAYLLVTAVLATMQSTQTNTIQISHIATLSGILLFATLVLAVLAARWQSQQIERPIQDLVQATKTVARGDLATRVPIQGPEELAQLAESFNAMLDAREAMDGALRQSKEKYSTLIEQIPAIIYRATADREKSTLYINSQINHLLGYSAQEWLAHPELWQDRIHPDDRARVADALKHLPGTAAPLTLEYRMYTRDEKLVWVQDTVQSISRIKSKTHLFQGIMLDITAQKTVQENLERQSALLDHVHDAIIATDTLYRITAWNHAAQEMYGWSQAQALGQTMHAIAPNTLSPEQSAALEQTAIAQGVAHAQLTQQSKTGATLLVESTLMPLHDPAGAVNGFISVNRNLTEQRAAEQALQQRTIHAEVLAHTAAVVNARLEFDAVANAIVHETQRALCVPLAFLFLYSEDKNNFQLVAAAGLSKTSIARLKQVPYVYPIAFDSPPSLLTRNWPSLAAWATGGAGDIPALTGALTVPIRHKHEWVGLVCAAATQEQHVFSSEENQLLSSVADQAALAISNARLFEQVRTGRARMQTLSRRLVEVQEMERHAIARELHDEIGQSLTGLSLVLEMAARASTNGVNAGLTEGQTIVNQIIKQVRNLSLELRPAMLDDLGLVPALTWQIQRYTAQTGIRVDLKLMGLEGNRFPAAVETAAYRIVQEGLTNVARYAHVSQAKVRLWTEEHSLGLMIEDEGAGFDPETVWASNQTSGLIGMRERAMLLGGQFVIESTLAQGTRINAKLPLRQYVERRVRERVL